MTTAASLGLDESQFHNLLGIVAACKAHGEWTPAQQHQGAVIAVETVLTESSMRMLASANVPESIRYSHDRLSWSYDGLGHDHASCGMYQQQTGWGWALPGTSTMNSRDGWGPPSVLMDAQKSTKLFLDALIRVRNWWTRPRWQAAQAVQGSAFPDRYQQQDARARRYVDAVWGAPVPQPKPTKKPVRHRTPDPQPTTGHAVVGVYVVQPGDTLGAIAHRYPQSWITPASLAHLNGLSNPDHIVIGQHLKIGA